MLETIIAKIEGLLLMHHHGVHERINQLEKLIVSSLETLQKQVADTNTAMAGALVLINGLKSRLADAIAASKAGDDHAALDQLAADLSTNTGALALAVQANTSAPAAAPEAPAAPADVPGGPAMDSTAAAAATSASVPDAPASTEAPAVTGSGESTGVASDPAPVSSDAQPAEAPAAAATQENVASGSVSAEPATGAVSGT